MFIEFLKNKDIVDIAITIGLVSDGEEFKSNFGYIRLNDRIEIRSKDDSVLYELFDFEVVNLVRYFKDQESMQFADEAQNKAYRKYMESRFVAYPKLKIEQNRLKETSFNKLDKLLHTNVKALSQSELLKYGKAVERSREKLYSIHKITGEEMLMVRAKNKKEKTQNNLVK